MPLAWFSLALLSCDAIFDIYPPEIEIIEPMEGVRYWNLLPCKLEITDNRMIDRVEIFFDDELVHTSHEGAIDTGFEFSSLESLPSTLKIVAYDQGGNWAEDSRDISLWYDVLVGSYDTPRWAVGVFVSGGYAYVADYESGLQIINVSNPASPTLVGSYDTQERSGDVFVSGSYAYVADGYSGLLIIDVSGLP